MQVNLPRWDKQCERTGHRDVLVILGLTEGKARVEVVEMLEMVGS